MQLLDMDEFPRALLLAVKRFMPCEYISLNEMTPTSVIGAIVEPDLPPEQLAVFAELGHENPLYQRYVATGDGRAYRFSDVATREELEATRLYQEFYAPIAVHHQMAFTLPSGADRVIAVALSRSHRNFSNAERAFVDRARPFLIQAYRNALAWSGPSRPLAERLDQALVEAGLTGRQADVMRLVALGLSNRDVAGRLELSPRTVQKHLELVFRVLGVTTRSAAAARAWELIDD
jgi:DNA-binding CsgD family transcriptional regulator